LRANRKAKKSNTLLTALVQELNRFEAPASVNMPIKYVACSGSRKYSSAYSKADVDNAVSYVSTGTKSLRKAAFQLNIPVRTLHNKVHRKHSHSFGGQTALTDAEEACLVSVFRTLSVWHCPVDQFDLTL